MKSPANIATIASELLAQKNLTLTSCTSIQSLWAGYGHICRLEANLNDLGTSETCQTEDRPQSLILKYIQPPANAQKSKSEALDEGHIRKVLSYQVEQYFYTHLAPQLPEDIAVASCIASIDSSVGSPNTTAMILSDLRQSFPVAGEKRGSLNEIQVEAAMSWLAGFHGDWWAKIDIVRQEAKVLPPLQHYKQHQTTILPVEGGVWLNGGYTYLATRMKEFADMQEDAEGLPKLLCEPVGSGGQSLAELVARFLAPPPSREAASSSQPYQTLIHGDVKSENLFTTAAGDAVAFYDFQYVGLGLGVCDLAKLFTCSVPIKALVKREDDIYTSSDLAMQPGEERLLRAYLTRLRKRSTKEYAWDVFVRHWETALVDWYRFQASWGVWGNSDWLEHRVSWILRDNEWREWLRHAVEDK